MNHEFKKYLTNNNFVLNQFAREGQGTTRKIIGRNVFRNIKVAIPPIEEQTAIANYLDQKTTQIDDLISKKERLIQLLEEERTAIINQAVTKGLDPTVPMKDSGIEWLGEIPERWEVKKLKYVANLKSGENITSENIKEHGDYPVYGGNGLRGYFSDYTNEGDYILIGRQGALCGNIKYAKNRFWASEHAIVCYLEPNINWLWFGKLLESMNLNQYNQSAAQPGLAVGVIKNLSIPYPKSEEQDEIVKFIIDFEKKTDELIEKTRNEIGLLKEYKTALISEVVTGKVDVRNWQPMNKN
jgi:type I restriction enzyme S subunit